MARSLQKETKGTKERVACVSLWVAIMVLGCLQALGHDSPEHEIEALTRKMAERGATAELLARRATEWRALRKYDEAANDLRRALLINSNSIPLLLEYGSVELERGNVCNAETVVRYGLTRAAESEKPALHMMLSKIAESRGLYDVALQDCERAMSSGEPQLEWHFTRARLMCRLGQHAKSAAVLKIAYEKIPNVALEIEWIEAMIDAGQYEEALKRVTKYSGRGRWRSAWFIREARAELGLKRAKVAKANLTAALAELDLRINPAKLDATLVADRTMARLLRGQRDAAAEDMEQLRGPLRNQVPGSTMARLERMFWRDGMRSP